MTFQICYRIYKCKVLLFGLTNGPVTYQYYMNDVLFDYLDDFCIAYLDNILIYSEDELEYELYIKKVLQQLWDTGLQADLKKYEFSITYTKYLGFIITIDSIKIDPKKVIVIIRKYLLIYKGYNYSQVSVTSIGSSSITIGRQLDYQFNLLRQISPSSSIRPTRTYSKNSRLFLLLY